ncbi:MULTISPECIES: CHAT domain-containing protein [Calothrix]|uniref:CHAT domain-containing protein n=2 Tax=Calothrix TaxID=1186 RepID=A0ABR8A5L2_9CYAN|nr:MULTISPECIES: CHAT domain-containing protein [Calothrix]MBD2195275.1 CHAT domain-containing protein [Calothrix parietina FACHB-288]MBD2223754.1 CHAT domain-containing protein [Calothrix anomala FACHB-343]
MRYYSQIYIVIITTLMICLSGCTTPQKQQVNQTPSTQQNSPENNQPSSQIKLLNEEAVKLSEQGQLKEGFQKLEQALTISTDRGERFWEAVTLNNMGRIYQKQANYAQALQSYQQALLINKELGDRVQLGKTYSNIGYLFDIQKQPELAIFFYKHCLINREQARLEPSLLSAPQPDAYSITVAQTYRILGDKLLKQGRVAEAQRSLDLLKVEELQGFASGVRGNQQTAKGINIIPQETATKQKLEQTLDNAVELGKELTKLRKIPPEQRSPQEKQRIEEIVLTQQKLLKQFNDFIASPPVKAQLDQISRAAKGQNLDLGSINELRDNLAKLPEKSVLIYPLVLQDSLELVVVSPESVPVHRPVKVTREQLNQTIATFRQDLQSPRRQDAKKTANQLYDWLIKPLENDIKLAGAKQLIYAPDDQLRYIPLSALYDGKQWLVERFSVNYITAASLSNFNTPPKRNFRALAGAFTKGNYQFQVGTQQLNYAGLQFAGQEVESIATTLPGSQKLLDQAFNPQATIPQMDDYPIVHLATHAAFVVGKPEDSFILFGNGDRIHLQDVANWSLPNVDLVVLSACETGLGGKLGNGEEILGFAYQMQKTGARATIASLWSVDDGGTQALMSAFYTLLSSGKLTKAEALRQTQIALITGKSPENNPLPIAISSGFSHPYYWAPFILIGNGL